MDPNAALARIRALCKDISANPREYNVETCSLVEAFEALDGWLGLGGFLPDAWRESEKQQAITAAAAVSTLHALTGELMRAANDRIRERKDLTIVLEALDSYVIEGAPIVNAAAARLRTAFNIDG